MAKEQVPPHSLDAEKALLGCILLDQKILDEVESKLRSEDFYRPTNQGIYQTMLDMHCRGIAIDMLSMKEYTDEVDPVYLIELTQAVVQSKNWETYADIIRKTSILRELVRIGIEAQAVGYESQPDDVESAVANVQSRVMGLSISTTKETVAIGTALHTLWKTIHEGGVPYFSPKGLDGVRLFAGDFVVIAGGTSAGKTAITLDWAEDWTKPGEGKKKVAYFEYEMTPEQLIARLVCKRTGVELYDLIDGNLTAEELDRVQDAMLEIGQHDLYVEEVWCDNHVLFSKIRKAAATGVSVVVIDHLGLVPIAEKHKSSDAKAIGKYLTNPLKRLAAELGITIIGLSQLNREGQQPDKFPKKRHLRDSGEIEQDASTILMLWSDYELNDDINRRSQIRDSSGIVREEELLKNDFNLVRVGIEKQRQGRSGWSKFFLFHGQHFRYEDRSETWSPIIDKPMF